MVICEARRQSYIGEVAVDRGKGENIGVEVDGFIKEKPGLNTRCDHGWRGFQERECREINWRLCHVGEEMEPSSQKVHLPPYH